MTLCLLTILYGLMLHATPIPPVPIKCIATENNNVTIEWEIPPAPNANFIAYEVGKVGSGVVATINDINNNSFTDNGAGSQVNQYYVSVLSTTSAGNQTTIGDTVSNIFLEINNPGTGTALLIWNHPINPLGSAMAGEYQVYKEYPAGTWTYVADVPFPSTTFRDTITICEGFINYRIQLPTSTCAFVSNVEGDVFEDNIVPDIPVLLNVDIDTLTNEVSLIWNENSQEDTYGYVIYTEDINGFLIEIDTVYGIGNTSFSHFPNTELGPLTYSVAAFDSCYTDVEPPTYQTSAKAEVHTTNFLTARIDVCERALLLDWTGYDGFDVSYYEIWGRWNDSAWQILDTTSLNFWSRDIMFGDTYQFSVRVISTGGNATSFSNTINGAFDVAGGPSFSFLAAATVEDNEISVTHRFGPDGGLEKLILERYNSSLDKFEPIDEALVGNENFVQFFDADVDVQRKSYSYRVALIDTCEQVLGYSNIGTTILADVITEDTEMRHTIQWSPYAEFEGDVVRYDIYRAIDGVFDTQPIASVTPDRRSYTDEVDVFLEESQGKFCYQIVAVEANNSYGFSEWSRSNTVCPIIEPIIYIPNAFSVGGLNPIFKPETSLHRIQDYEFAIIDRMGRTIYKTKDPSEGWDGSIEGTGEVAREGVYVYSLTLRDGNGIQVVRNGHVTLLDYR